MYVYKAQHFSQQAVKPWSMGRTGSSRLPAGSSWHQTGLRWENSYRFCYWQTHLYHKESYKNHKEYDVIVKSCMKISMISSTFWPFVRKTAECPQRREAGVNTEAEMIIYSISSPPECVYLWLTRQVSVILLSARLIRILIIVLWRKADGA